MLCIVTINVLRLFLEVPRVGLRSVIVVFPDHTYSLFDLAYSITNIYKSSTRRDIDQITIIMCMNYTCTNRHRYIPSIPCAY